MKRQAAMLMTAVALVLSGCASTEDAMGNEESTSVVETSMETSMEASVDPTGESGGQESTDMTEESESESSEEVKAVIPKVEIDYDNLIDEREALDMAYNYLYEDSEYNEYSVYCDEIWHQGVQRWGYIVVQFAYDEGDYTRRYEKYDPDADLLIGREGRIELLYDGLSKNELFYTFWLCGYIRDDEDWGHRSTYNFIAVSIDGKIIERERIDETGTDEWLEHWDWYYNLTTQ